MPQRKRAVAASAKASARKRAAPTPLPTPTIASSSDECAALWQRGSSCVRTGSHALDALFVSSDSRFASLPLTTLHTIAFYVQCSNPTNEAPLVQSKNNPNGTNAWGTVIAQRALLSQIDGTNHTRTHYVIAGRKHTHTRAPRPSYFARLPGAACHLLKCYVLADTHQCYYCRRMRERADFVDALAPIAHHKPEWWWGSYPRKWCRECHVQATTCVSCEGTISNEAEMADGFDWGVVPAMSGRPSGTPFCIFCQDDWSGEMGDQSSSSESSSSDSSSSDDESSSSESSSSDSSSSDDESSSSESSSSDDESMSDSQV